MISTRQLHIAPADSHAILLDIERDRYFGVSPAASPLLLAFADQTTDASTASPRVQTLLARILGEDHSGPVRPVQLLKTEVSAPRQMIWPTSVKPWSIQRFRISLQAFIALAQIQRALGRGSLARLIDWLRSEKRACASHTPTASIQTLVNAFSDIRPWFPVKPICRLDHMALALLLWRNGHAADLIWGAMLYPFHAHCWVQIGDVAVNETDERASEYHPVLTV